MGAVGSAGAPGPLESQPGTAPGSFVIATAGHVDHGKSTLVRALTGIEPDRWDEERRRGLTIDLGFAWTTLPSGRIVSFVDVPGHERFLGNMLAGVGPAPIVLFVVAADEGWMPQSDDHRDAIAALGIEHGLLVVTRADLAPEAVDAVVARARAELADTGIADAPAVVVSGATGEGLEELRARLDEVLAQAPVPDPHARIRLWIDRAFTISGAGTVVTGTLGAGTLRPDDVLALLSGGSGAGARSGAADLRDVTVRGLQSQDAAVSELGPVTRAAVNLRGVPADAVHRGDVLLSPGAWSLTAVVDVRGLTGAALDEAPRELTAHVGTAAVQATVRPLGAEHARLTLARGLPLTLGDRLLLRAPGDRAVFAGVQVLDVDPQELARRGDGRRRAEALAGMDPRGDLAGEVQRRGAVPVGVLEARGFAVPGAEPVAGDPAAGEVSSGEVASGRLQSEELPGGVRRVRDLLVDEERLAAWARTLAEAVRAELAADPLSPGLTGKAAVDRLSLPDLSGTGGTSREKQGGAGQGGDAQQAARATSALLSALVREAELTVEAGRIRPHDAQRSMGAAEPAIRALEDGWTQAPFRAPEARDLQRLKLGARELAAAEAQGRLVRLGGQDARGGAGTRGGTAGQGDPIVLGPGAPAQAMRILTGLSQPFTTSEARQALDTTRRTVIPLLEHLDARGWTVRRDAGHREVARRSGD